MLICEGHLTRLVRRLLDEGFDFNAQRSSYLYTKPRRALCLPVSLAEAPHLSFSSDLHKKLCPLTARSHPLPKKVCSRTSLMTHASPSFVAKYLSSSMTYPTSFSLHHELAEELLLQDVSKLQGHMSSRANSRRCVVQKVGRNRIP